MLHFEHICKGIYYKMYKNVLEVLLSELLLFIYESGRKQVYFNIFGKKVLFS